MNQLSIFDCIPPVSNLGAHREPGAPCVVDAAHPNGGFQPASPARNVRTGQGRGKRDTSRAAYAGIKANGKLGKQQQEIFSHLTRNAHKDFTRAELAAATGLRLSSVCGRVRELLDLKLLRETDRRECTMTCIKSHGLTAA